jgi:hypothetical protein
MKRLPIIFLLLFTCISSTVSAAETTNLALGFNSVTKSLSIVNYTHNELPLSSVTTPAGYTELSPNGNIQVPTAAISMVPEQGLTTSTSITWGSASSKSPVGTITVVEWKVNGVVVSAPPTIFAQAGTQTVELRVKNSSGTWSAWLSKSFAIVQSNRVPTAAITMTPSSSITDATSITWGYNTSTDPDNDSISSAEWQLDSNPVVTSTPNGIVTTVGSHTMKLRVKDSRGLWSNWVSQNFSVTASTPSDLPGYTEVTKPMTSSGSNGFVATTDYEYPGLNGYKSFDGSMSTGWGTGYTVIPSGGHWLKLDLGTAQKITALKMTPAYARTGQGAVKDWVLYGSNDNVTYTAITSGYHDNSETTTVHKFANGTSYRYYRMNVTSTYDTNNACTSFWELRYYK